MCLNAYFQVLEYSGTDYLLLKARFFKYLLESALRAQDPCTLHVKGIAQNIAAWLWVLAALRVVRKGDGGKNKIKVAYTTNHRKTNLK